MAPRQDRPAVEEHRRQVHAGGGHEHAGQALVAPGQGDQAVEALGVHHRLDGVGDDLAAHQRRPHPLVAHRDAVGHRDGHELEREPAGVAHADLRALGQPVERHVAGRDLVPRRRHPHLRLVPVVVGHPDRPQHRPRSRPVGPVGDVPAPRLDVDRCLALLVSHGREATGAPIRRAPKRVRLRRRRAARRLASSGSGLPADGTARNRQVLRPARARRSRTTSRIRARREDVSGRPCLSSEAVLWHVRPALERDGCSHGASPRLVHRRLGRWHAPGASARHVTVARYGVPVEDVLELRRLGR